MDFEAIKKELAVAGLTAAASLVFPRVRAIALRVWRGLLFPIRMPAMIFAELRAINAKLDDAKEKVDAVAIKAIATEKKVDAIKHQVEVNGGGSLKDSLNRLESYRKNDFWRMPRPALEMNALGHVTAANNAACRLFHVSDPRELLRRSYLRFLDDATKSGFIKAFRETAATGSLYRVLQCGG